MKIGLLGYGTIGIGVDTIVSARTDMSVKTILDIKEKDGMNGRFTDSIETIVNDTEIDTVVEVMGGTEPSHTYAVKALKAKKNFVTANKALVAAHYEELVKLAKENGVSFRCTASAGGSIPWLYNLERARRVDDISEVGGIMNGTTNFIMNAMNNENADFAETLKNAQELGYAEKDPSADIDGLDIRRKLNISANIAFDCLIDELDIPAFGIRNVKAADIANGKKMGKIIKLVAFGKREGSKVAAFVEPVFLDSTDVMAGVSTNFNLVYYIGNNCGYQAFVGQGAGRFPTAYNVVQDLVDIKYVKPGFYTDTMNPQKVDNTFIRHPYYVRTVSKDAFLDQNTDKDCGEYIITKELTAAEMHMWAKEQLNKDENLFICAL